MFLIPNYFVRVFSSVWFCVGLRWKNHVLAVSVKAEGILGSCIFWNASIFPINYLILLWIWKPWTQPCAASLHELCLQSSLTKGTLLKRFIWGNYFLFVSLEKKWKPKMSNFHHYFWTECKYLTQQNVDISKEIAYLLKILLKIQWQQHAGYFKILIKNKCMGKMYSKW